mmetsp:Transcript_27549/g.66989  ORF Transcript_27549/g.66989 Transcript_27549/m.66989 type:complete len:200 (-) Transcript_27549:317-916(-)
MTRSRSNETIPKTHFILTNGIGRLIFWNHKANIRFNGQIQVCLQQNVHVSVYTTMNQKNAVSKQVSLERTGSQGIIGLSHFWRKMCGQKVFDIPISIEDIAPSRLLEGFNETAHVGIIFGCDILEPSLVNDLGNEPGGISGILWWSNGELFGNEFLWNGCVTKSLAIALTKGFTPSTVASHSILQTIHASFVSWQTIFL